MGFARSLSRAVDHCARLQHSFQYREGRTANDAPNQSGYRLAVRFAAMPDGQDLKGVSEIVKADAVVADAKAVLLRV
jgi:hypothetical protein